MKIYTKSGDQGTTALWGGARVKKSDPRVSAYGTLDEANSAMGAALSFLPKSASSLAQVEVSLTRIQHELFQVGSELATASGAKNTCPFISLESVSILEREIDALELTLPALKNFILPGGSSAGSFLHLARTIIRRAERECVELNETEALRPEVIQYLNRLSDYLFVCARFINHELKLPETLWSVSKK